MALQRVLAVPGCRHRKAEGRSEFGQHTALVFVVVYDQHADLG
jgi:hypothetical protein